MPKIKITAPFQYFRHGDIANYSLSPEMGVVGHLPRRVCDAAVEAGAAVFVKPIPQKRGSPKKPLGKA